MQHSRGLTGKARLHQLGVGFASASPARWCFSDPRFHPQTHSKICEVFSVQLFLSTIAFHAMARFDVGDALDGAIASIFVIGAFSASLTEGPLMEPGFGFIAWIGTLVSPLEEILVLLMKAIDLLWPDSRCSHAWQGGRVAKYVNSQPCQWR